MAEGRLRWADAAKGACIVLVVLLHVTTKHVVQLSDVDPTIREAWDTLSQWLRPIRMPLFFVLSGWFAARAVRRPLRTTARTKVVQPYVLYVVWMAVQTLAVDVWIRPYVESASLAGFLRSLAVPTGNLWYLWALSVYFLVAALTPTTARTAVMIMSIAASVAVTSWWHPLGPRPTDLVQFAAFFLVGSLAPRVVDALVDATTRTRAAIAVGSFAVATVTVRSTEIGDVIGVTPALYALGVIAGCAASVVLPPRPAELLASLGRRTLPIYVMHVPVLMVFSWFVRRDGWRGSSPVDAAMWIYPAIVTAGVITITLALHGLLQRVGAWWLFSLTPPRRTLPPLPSSSRSDQPDRPTGRSTRGTGS